MEPLSVDEVLALKEEARELKKKLAKLPEKTGRDYHKLGEGVKEQGEQDIAKLLKKQEKE